MHARPSSTPAATHDTRLAFVPRVLLQDLLADDDSHDADAADQFLELALVDLAGQIEQLADLPAWGTDRDAARDERTQRALGFLL
jgi:hypothetical protein